MSNTAASGNLATTAATAASTILASASTLRSPTTNLAPVAASARASASALAASALALSASFPASMSLRLSVPISASSSFLSVTGTTAVSSARDSSPTSSLSASPFNAAAFFVRSRSSAPSANAASAFACVTPTTRRTPRPSPSSLSSANRPISRVLATCVPPQNSMAYLPHSAVLGASSICATPGPPTATTRTGSGYCSPKTARRPSISLAASNGDTCVCTSSAASICALTAVCASASSASLSGLPYAKSNRSLASSTSEPRCSHATPSASRSAQLNTCVAVWFFAIGARRA
mmetsp:Transcript_52524/g.114562  ORF Transcript_52524/g.114562 Transcript_52524/m.114562 type:complete len:292 (-) Transcript_52524:1198-2073(-)